MENCTKYFTVYGKEQCFFIEKQNNEIILSIQTLASIT